MKILKWLGFSQKTKPKQAETSSGETCPICWGHQQYDGKIRIFYEDKQIDVKNHRATYVRSQKLVKDSIEGHIIKKKEIKVCPTCGNKK